MSQPKSYRLGKAVFREVDKIDGDRYYQEDDGEGEFFLSEKCLLNYGATPIPEDKVESELLHDYCPKSPHPNHCHGYRTDLEEHKTACVFCNEELEPPVEEIELPIRDDKTSEWNWRVLITQAVNRLQNEWGTTYIRFKEATDKDYEKYTTGYNDDIQNHIDTLERQVKALEYLARKV